MHSPLLLKHDWADTACALLVSRAPRERQQEEYPKDNLQPRAWSDPSQGSDVPGHRHCWLRVFQGLVVPVSPREMFLLSSLQQSVSRQIGVLLNGAHMNHVLVHLKALCRQTCSVYQRARGCKYFTQCVWALTGHLWSMGLRTSSFHIRQ